MAAETTPVEPDDEALTWEGGGPDPTQVDSAVAETADDGDDEVERPEPNGSSATLVAYGVFGGIFLVYTVGWLIAIQGMSVGSAGVLNQFMDRVAEFLALLSPALWFFGVFLLVRATNRRARILWLVLGVVLLAPLPFVLGI